jgi:hypothetical protein
MNKKTARRLRLGAWLVNRECRETGQSSLSYSSGWITQKEANKKGRAPKSPPKHLRLIYSSSCLSPEP